MSRALPLPPPGEQDARLQRPGWWWAIRDSRTIIERNLRHFVRQPRLLVFSTIQPVMYVLMFTFVFGGVAASALPEGVNYISFLLPGIFVQSAAFRTTHTAVGLAEDLERGVIDRFRSMPMARIAVLAGRTGADLMRSLAVILLMVAIGYLVGFRFTQGVVAAVGAIAAVSLFAFALSWVFAYLALVVPGAEAVQSAGFVVVFPLVFASSIFVPVETMPGWLQTFASFSPITQTADAARALSIGGEIGRPLVTSLAWSITALVVFATLSTRKFRARA